MSGGVSRLKEHLAGRQGNVAACTQVSLEVRKQMLAHLIGKKKDKQSAQQRESMIREELMHNPVQIDNDSSEQSEEDEEERQMRRAIKESRNMHREEEEMRRSTGGNFQRSRSVNIRGEREYGGSSSTHRTPGVTAESENIGPMDTYLQKKGVVHRLQSRQLSKELKMQRNTLVELSLNFSSTTIFLSM